jgi:integrase
MWNAGSARRGSGTGGLYKAADGHYRSAGTFTTAERALTVAEEAERHAERADSGEVRRRWEKSRDADESYLDEQIWNRIWASAVAESGIPFKPTAYQVRHTHASWLIDAGENPKAVMHRLGQADLRTTARYVRVLDETGESAAKRFEGLLPPL